MSKAVLREERASVEELEKLAKRASELKANLNALLQALENKYSEDPRFSSIIGNLASLVKPSEPVSEVSRAYTSLQKYVEELEERLKTLTQYTIALERLRQELEKLEREVEGLEPWHDILKDIAPHLSAEAFKVLHRAKRIINQPLEEDPRKASEEVAILAREARSLRRVCRTVYVNRAKEMLASTSQLLKTLRKVATASHLLEASKARAYYEELSKLRDRLERSVKNPPDAAVDLLEVKGKLQLFEKEIEELSKRLLSREEEIASKELERFSKAVNGRSVSYSTLLETLSRRTGFSIERVAYLLYVLEKKGFARLQVKTLA